MPVKNPIINAANPPVDADTTTVAFAQAEPGHDVFAGKVEEKPKSESLAQRPVEAVPQQSESSLGSASDNELSSEEPLSAINDGESNSSFSTDDAKVAVEPSSSEQDKAQGPAEEADAEAEKARQELFPEENA